ncbi:MAG: hypothetical protein JOZ56_04535 [Actinobacteria bacterium]|nr:hypothetical protein [Actinomycetota bacterium]
MRSKLAPTVLAGALVLASLVAYAPGGHAAVRPSSPLVRAAQRTAATPSLRFDLTEEIQTARKLPYLLNARGALADKVAKVQMKIADVRTPSGQVLTGPSAIEQTDGTFLYLRSTVTTALAGGLWVREPLAALKDTSPELRVLHAISPRALVQLLTRAHDLRASDNGRVYHATLPYTDATVASTLAGLEAGTQYRHLRLTAWISPHGRVLMLLLSGRTEDKSSTFLLTLTLDGFGKPVTITPPRSGSFVDYDLGQLAS